MGFPTGSLLVPYRFPTPPGAPPGPARLLAVAKHHACASNSFRDHPNAMKAPRLCVKLLVLGVTGGSLLFPDWFATASLVAKHHACASNSFRDHHKPMKVPRLCVKLLVPPVAAAAARCPAFVFLTFSSTPPGLEPCLSGNRRSRRWPAADRGLVLCPANGFPLILVARPVPASARLRKAPRLCVKQPPRSPKSYESATPVRQSARPEGLLGVPYRFPTASLPLP